MTLEWLVSSPPPIFNFDRVPTVVGGPYEYGVPGAVHGILAPTPTPVGAGAGIAHPEGHTPVGGAGSGGHQANDEEAQPMKEVLVIANRTLGGAKLLEAVRERAAAGDVRFRLVVPHDASPPRAS